MKTLIDNIQVVALAFSSEEMLDASAITPLDILEAEDRYICPVVGEPLADRLLEGAYPELLNDYVAPALAAWVRYVVQPMLPRRTAAQLVEGGDGGAVTEPLNCREVYMQKLLRRKASTLLYRLGEYLDANADKYPEYNPDNNALNRCTINGSIIQIY